jgi:hypothetical protein
VNKRVFKLDGEPLYIFGSVTVPQFIVYGVLGLILNVVGGMFVANGLITLTITGGIVFVIHNVASPFLNQIPLYQINNFINFVRSKDVYELRPDPMALPNVVNIKLVEVNKHGRGTRRMVAQAQ